MIKTSVLTLWEIISCRPCLPPTHYLPQDGLKFLILLCTPAKYWDYSHVPLYPTQMIFLFTGLSGICFLHIVLSHFYTVTIKEGKLRMLLHFVFPGSEKDDCAAQTQSLRSFLDLFWYIWRRTLRLILMVWKPVCTSEAVAAQSTGFTRVKQYHRRGAERRDREMRTKRFFPAPAFRLGLHTSVDLIWILSHRAVQKLASSMILD